MSTMHALAQRCRVGGDVGELRAELGDHAQVDAVLQLGVRLEPGRRHGPGGREALVELHLRSLPSEDLQPAAVGRGGDSAPGVAPVEVEARELPERHGGVGLRVDRDDRLPFVDAARDLAVARDEDVGLPPEHAVDVAVRDADPAVGAVEDEARRGRPR